MSDLNVLRVVVVDVGVTEARAEAVAVAVAVVAAAVGDVVPPTALAPAPSTLKTRLLSHLSHRLTLQTISECSLVPFFGVQVTVWCVGHSRFKFKQVVLLAFLLYESEKNPIP